MNRFKQEIIKTAKNGHAETAKIVLKWVKWSETRLKSTDQYLYPT